jgi:hypothetical protein
MNRTRNFGRAVALTLLAGALALLWFGGGWAWRQLLRLHGVH